MVQRPRLRAKAAITVHAPFAGKRRDGEVHQCLVFEVAAHELNRRVVTVTEIKNCHFANMLPARTYTDLQKLLICAGSRRLG